MNKYYYDGMNRISKMEGLSRFKLGKSVYLLYSDNTESLVSSLKDIENHEELFGYEKKVGLLECSNVIEPTIKCDMCGCFGKWTNKSDGEETWLTCKCGFEQELMK